MADNKIKPVDLMKQKLKKETEYSLLVQQIKNKQEQLEKVKEDLNKLDYTLYIGSVKEYFINIENIQKLVIDLINNFFSKLTDLSAEDKKKIVDTFVNDSYKVAKHVTDLNGFKWDKNHSIMELFATECDGSIVLHADEECPIETNKLPQKIKFIMIKE